MIRPLLIDDAVLLEISRVQLYAAAHSYSLQDGFRILKGQDRPPGDNPGHTCVIPMGYRCVFSLEQQPIGLCRHLSVSVLGEGQAPNEAAFAKLAELFGFQKGDEANPRGDAMLQAAGQSPVVCQELRQILTAPHTYLAIEDITFLRLGPGPKSAINLLQKISAV